MNLGLDEFSISALERALIPPDFGLYKKDSLPTI